RDFGTGRQFGAGDAPARDLDQHAAGNALHIQRRPGILLDGNVRIHGEIDAGQRRLVGIDPDRRHMSDGNAPEQHVAADMQPGSGGRKAGVIIDRDHAVREAADPEYKTDGADDQHQHKSADGDVTRARLHYPARSPPAPGSSPSAWRAALPRGPWKYSLIQ